jgi:glycosyltransferase involved in cell wall biosynthesis
MPSPRCTIIIPVKNEGSQIVKTLTQIREFVTLEFNCLLIVDSFDDLTIPILHEFLLSNPNFEIKLNDRFPGPAGAILTGIQASQSDVLVVTMSDGSDDPQQIEDLVLLVERGISVACASRYMPGGQAVGQPFFKGILSRMAGLSLHFLGRVGTHDSTNNFKAYSRRFLSTIEIESKYGFEFGLEMVVKAKRLRESIAEIPTIWIERSFGQSKFNLRKWLPRYFNWYFKFFLRVL